MSRNGLEKLTLPSARQPFVEWANVKRRKASERWEMLEASDIMRNRMLEEKVSKIAMATWKCLEFSTIRWYWNDFGKKNKNLSLSDKYCRFFTSNYVQSTNMSLKSFPSSHPFLHKFLRKLGYLFVIY